MISSRRKEVALVASGIILGAAIAAPVAGAALTAQQSSQKIVVDGKPVQIEAVQHQRQQLRQAPRHRQGGRLQRQLRRDVQHGANQHEN